MKKKVMKKCMDCIKNSSLSYSEEKLEEIEYGLEAIYILITKSIIIFSIAYLLGILKPLVIFTILYAIIRMPSFGLHATKSSICLFSSLLVFILGVYLAVYTVIPLTLRVILGIYCIIRIYMNAPADTHNKPIINKKRRDIYKTVSTLIAIVYVFTSILIQDIFMGNALILSLFIQVCMISPHVYKLFNLPYNNYKSYILDNGLNKI